MVHKRLQWADAVTGEATPAIPAMPGKPLPLLNEKRAEKLLRTYVKPAAAAMMAQINEGVEDEEKKWTLIDCAEHLVGKREVSPPAAP